MIGRRTLLCALFALGSTGCSFLFSASQDCGGKSCDSCAGDESCCGSGWSLKDEFEGDKLSALRWIATFGGEDAASVHDGSLFVNVSSEVYTWAISSRSALRLDGTSGRSVSIHMRAEPPERVSNVSLRGVLGTPYIFSLEVQGIRASGALGGGDAAYESAAFLRFESEPTETGDLMHWKTSSDGQSWVDVYFEPWDPEPVWLSFETYGPGVAPLEVLGVNDEIDRASPPCSVELLQEEFDGDALNLTTVANRWGNCHGLSGGQLVLPGNCLVQTALSYSLEEAAVSVDVAGFDGNADFGVELADGSTLSLEWDADGVDLLQLLGSRGRLEAVPEAVRLRHHDGTLYGECLVDDKWEAVGSISASADVVATVVVGLSSWNGVARFDNLRGSSP